MTTRTTSSSFFGSLGQDEAPDAMNIGVRVPISNYRVVSGGTLAIPTNPDYLRTVGKFKAVQRAVNEYLAVQLDGGKGQAQLCVDGQIGPLTLGATRTVIRHLAGVIGDWYGGADRARFDQIPIPSTVDRLARHVQDYAEHIAYFAGRPMNVESGRVGDDRNHCGPNDIDRATMVPDDEIDPDPGLPSPGPGPGGGGWPWWIWLLIAGGGYGAYRMSKKKPKARKKKRLGVFPRRPMRERPPRRRARARAEGG